jgi:tetratricopeptide (TPR) repeat protein
MEALMNRHLFVGSVLAFLVILFSFMLTSCSKTEEVGKLPITTTSEEALKDYLKGRELTEKLRGQEALKHFENAIAKDPDFGLAHLNCAFSQPTAKGFFDQLDKAVSTLNKISEGEQLWIKGVQDGVHGFPMKQRENFKKLVAAYPEDERAHNILGNHYFGQQEFELAIEEYEKAIKINSNFSPTYNQLGYAYRSLENYNEAENAFKKYIELIPDDPNPYDSYAELQMKMGNFQASINTYRKALQVNPNFAASHIGIATNLNFLDKHQDAREQLQKFFEMARNEGEQRQARFAMTVSYLDEGNKEKALEELKWQYALGKNGNDAANMAGDLGFMGNILFEDGQYEEAMQKYEKALSIMEASNLSEEVKDNARRFFLYNSGRIALMNGEIDTAKKKSDEFQKAANAINNRFQLWLSHELDGMIALQEKNYDVAISAFNQANQQNPYTFYRLALTYEGKGDKVKAKELMKKAANHNTLNSLNYTFIRTKAQQMVTMM